MPRCKKRRRLDSGAGAFTDAAGWRFELQVFLPHHPNPQLLQLTLADRRGRVHHQVNCLRGLGEGNHLSQAFRAGQNHHDAVESQRNSAVRRRAVLQRLQEEAEARLLLLRRHAHEP